MLELNTKDALHDGELRLRPTTDPGVGDAKFGGADRIPHQPLCGDQWRSQEVWLVPNSTTRTRPDKVGGLVGDPVSEKVWSGPPSGIWTLLDVSRAGNRPEEPADGPSSGFRTRKHIGLLLSNQTISAP